MAALPVNNAAGFCVCGVVGAAPLDFYRANYFLASAAFFGQSN
jgi:hypothetical protein